MASIRGVNENAPHRLIFGAGRAAFAKRNTSWAKPGRKLLKSFVVVKLIECEQFREYENGPDVYNAGSDDFHYV